MSPRRAPALDTLEFDHLELWVGNAKQAAHYYCTAFGFEPLAYAGPETGVKGRASYVVRQNDLTLVLTSTLSADDAIADHVRRHGDGVRDVAFRTPDAREAFASAVAGGARAVTPPAVTDGADGRVATAQIATYGDTVHSFVERTAYRGTWLPGYQPWAHERRAPERVGLMRIDHCVGNVGWNEMDRWCDYYARALGFTAISANDHIVYKGPWIDGPTLLAASLPFAEGLSLATTIGLPVVRGPAVFAKTMAQLDQLSGGRVIAGVSTGSNP